MSSSNEIVKNIQSCAFPNALCATKTGGTLRAYDISDGKVVNNLRANTELGFFFIYYDDEDDPVTSFVLDQALIKSHSIFSLCVLKPKDMSVEDAISGCEELLQHFDGDFVMHYSDLTGSRFPRTILETVIGTEDPLNVFSMKTITKLDKFTVFTASDSSEGWKTVVGEISGDDNLKLAIPTFEGQDDDEVATLLNDRIIESLTETYTIQKLTLSTKKAVLTGFASKSGVKTASVSTVAKAVETFDAEMDKLRNNSKSCLNSDANVAKIVEKTAEIIELSKKVTFTAEDRFAIDLYKGAQSDKNIKAKPPGNFPCSFEAMPQSLDTVDSMEFHEKPKYDSKFFYTITGANFKEMGVSTNDRKAFIQAVVREFARKIIELYGDDGVISDEKYIEIFEGRANISNSGGSHGPAINRFNKALVATGKQSETTAKPSATNRFAGLLNRGATAPAKSPISSVAKPVSRISTPNFAKKPAAETVVEVSSTFDDLYDVTRETIDNLHSFRWKHVNRECRIVEAPHDGDTMKVLVKIPVREFHDTFHEVRNKKEHLCILDGEVTTTGNYLILFDIRCHEYDAAETYTQHGLDMTKAMHMLYDTLNEKRIKQTITFTGSSTFEREVADIYINGVRLAEAFSKLEIDGEPLVLYPYSGREKSKFSAKYLAQQTGVEDPTQDDLNEAKLKKADQAEYLETQECMERGKIIYEQMVELFKLNEVQEPVKKTITANPASTAKTLLTKTTTASKPASVTSLLNKLSIGNGVKAAEKAPEEVAKPVSKFASLLGRKTTPAAEVPTSTEEKPSGANKFKMTMLSKAKAPEAVPEAKAPSKLSALLTKSKPSITLSKPAAVAKPAVVKATTSKKTPIVKDDEEDYDGGDIPGMGFDNQEDEDENEDRDDIIDIEDQISVESSDDDEVDDEESDGNSDNAIEDTDI